MKHKKENEFSEWYQELLTKSELLDYHEVSGCYVIRPNAYHIWTQIQETINARLRGDGARQCYFPLFISQNILQKEKDHIEGFSPEVAWVTRYGL